MNAEVVGFVGVVMAGISIIISIASWVKNRKIYGIDISRLRKDDYINEKLAMLNLKLEMGRYTILNVSETDSHYVFILGNVVKKRTHDKVLSHAVRDI